MNTILVYKLVISSLIMSGFIIGMFIDGANGFIYVVFQLLISAVIMLFLILFLCVLGVPLT